MYRPQCHSRSVVASFFGASDRQADYYRYIAEFRSGDEKSKAAEEARKAYADAAKVAKDDLAVTHPIRLGLALNYSVFMYEVLNDPDEACKMARTAFEDKRFKHAKLLNHPFGSTTIYGTPCMMTKNMGLNWAFHGLPQFFKVPKPLFSLATSPMYPLPVLDTLQKIVSLLVNIDIPIKNQKTS